MRTPTPHGVSPLRETNREGLRSVPPSPAHYGFLDGPICLRRDHSTRILPARGTHPRELRPDQGALRHGKYFHPNETSFKTKILGALAHSAQIAPQPSLCGADGLTLSTAGTYSLPVEIANAHVTHPITFIDNLQVDALIGMDLMHKCKISINTKHNQICLFTSPTQSPAPSSTLACKNQLPFNQ